jgi:hypothetical protein
MRDVFIFGIHQRGIVQAPIIDMLIGEQQQTNQDLHSQIKDESFILLIGGMMELNQTMQGTAPKSRQSNSQIKDQRPHSLMSISHQLTSKPMSRASFAKAL